MFKKLRILGLALSILLVAGCGKAENASTTQTTETSKVNTVVYDTLKDAVNKLNTPADAKVYASAVYINGKQDTVWLNYILEDYNYTVYPVDDEGNFILGPDVTEDTKYIMTDYSDAENAYVLTEADSYATLGYESNKVLDNRKDMFMGYMLDKFTSLNLYDAQEDSEGTVVEVYKATLPAEYIPYIVSNGNYAIFDNYKNKLTDEDAKKFTRLYSDHLGKMYICNDATVYIYISEGDLLGVELEYSGAGVVNTYSMFITEPNLEVRSPLDKSKVTSDYTADFSKYGAMLGDAKTYEEGMEVLGMLDDINSSTQQPTEQPTEQTEQAQQAQQAQ